MRLFRKKEIFCDTFQLKISADLNLSYPAVKSAIGELMNAGVISELTGKERNKLHSYTDFVALLNL